MNRGAGAFIAPVWSARGVFGSIVPCVDDGALFTFWSILVIFQGGFVYFVCWCVCHGNQQIWLIHTGIRSYLFVHFCIYSEYPS